jgi:hypothetical protein
MHGQAEVFFSVIIQVPRHGGVRDEDMALRIINLGIRWR